MPFPHATLRRGRFAAGPAASIALALCLACGAGGDHARGEEGTRLPVLERATREAPSEGPPLVARVEGRPIALADFEAFLSEARFPGYRPATGHEARRLLEAFLGEVLLQQSGHEESSPEASRLNRYRDDRRRSLRRELALEEARVEILSDALASVVEPIDGSRPPAPPTSPVPARALR